MLSTKEIVIVSGMSGSGKTVALKLLEDMGYNCIDNLPIDLLSKFFDLLVNPLEEYRKVALGIDIRSGEALEKLKYILGDIKNKGIEYKILFLDANDEALIKRYKETRRIHPLAYGKRLEEGIVVERKSLKFLKEKADFVLDTSSLLSKELKNELINIFSYGKDYPRIFVNILSFGFMYGIPKDVDLVFDVRFLPNPYYDLDLRMQTGEDAAVREYVFRDKNAGVFLEKLEDMVKFLIPNYINEGKTQLVIGIGCTGGQHRSVSMAYELYQSLKDMDKINLRLEHRDMQKNKHRIA
jgi:UPF0042 nucleotide-binding protein ROSINTL182_05100